MDELVTVKDFKEQELKFLHSIRALSKKCQVYEKNTYSALDPIATILSDLKLIEDSSILLLSKHIEFFEKLDIFCVISQNVAELLSDVKVINAYEQLLTNATNVIMNTNVVLFRTGDSSIIATLMQIYQRLTLFESFSNINNISNGFIKLRNMLSTFESNFFAKYKLLNENNLNFDNVYDLLSHSMDKIQPIKFDVFNVECHTPFKLSKTKFFNENNILVDLAQLNTGELAILRINSGRLPKIFKNSKDLLSELIHKNYYLLSVGRTLLFKTLKPNDLKLIRISGTTVELETITGNNVTLKLVCMDPLKWTNMWKPYFEKQFSGKQTVKYVTKRKPMEGLLRESSKISNGLSDLTLNPMSQNLPILSKVPSLHEEPSICGSEVSSEPSLRDIESLSYEKLMELDQSIEMKRSPTPQPSPKFTQLRSVSQTFSVDEVITDEQCESSQGIFSSKTMNLNSRDDEDDLESMFSTETDPERTVVKVSSNSIFNPNADTYKPMLHKPASSSLLSLFTNRNKPNLSIETFESSSGSIFTNTATSQYNTPESAISDYQTPITQKSDVGIPNGLDLSDVITEQTATKITRWSGKDWDILGHVDMKLVISKIQDKEVVLTAYSDDSKNKCIFIIKITPHWKCFRSTAQDVQLKVPPSNFVVSAIETKDTVETITIRCKKVDNLLNTLLHCIKGNVPSSLSTSSTIRTLSTSTSSCFSDNLQRSSTYQSSFEADKTQMSGDILVSEQLLLAAVKVKRHENIQQKWNMQELGSVDLIAQESNNVRFGIKFHFITQGSNSPAKEYSNNLKVIRRLGRTGIIVPQEDKDQLFEFTSQIVAEEVYRLIQGI
ncbi:hypothetical protein C6P45_003424 [Maudiozyma exigua]|uniref:Uncharacterized protein n=1 Tax=Maudiozyma exigua TaxID=34358 RepID=A0A9P6WCB0_MAUEX|nr:hypothetical protein C6P45_003424 [Kazachstania exigua]